MKFKMLCTFNFNGQVYNQGEERDVPADLINTFINHGFINGKPTPPVVEYATLKNLVEVAEELGKRGRGRPPKNV